jgi:serine/threonine-protein kinase
MSPRSCRRCGATFTSGAESCALDGTRLKEGARDPLIGRRMAHYLIFEPLGEGGFGRVYRAGQLFLEQPVAVKVPYGEILASPRARERFRLEAEASARIRHPNVVQVLDFGATKRGLCFVVMEHLGRHTLADAIKTERRLAVPRAATLARQIALGLSAAHAAGVVHRDLKPSNIMLAGSEARPVAKILDFGLAAIPARGPYGFGTPAYMAPEQILSDDIDARADLYALGAILYEMLTGLPPFLGEAAQVLSKHLGAVPDPIPGAGALGGLAQKLLKKRPEDRPSSAMEVAGLIELLDLGALPVGLTEMAAAPEPPLDLRPGALPPEPELDRSLSVEIRALRRERRRGPLGLGLLAASVALGAWVWGLLPRSAGRTVGGPPPPPPISAPEAAPGLALEAAAPTSTRAAATTSEAA